VLDNLTLYVYAASHYPYSVRQDEEQVT
jgi:hypothetical protein